MAEQAKNSSPLAPPRDDRKARRRLGGLLLVLLLAIVAWPLSRQFLRRPASRSAPAPAKEAATPPDIMAPVTALAGEQRWMEAAEILKAARRSGNETAETHRALGRCLGSLGWMEEAIGEYEKALRLEPAHIDTYISLSTTYRSIGRRNEALDALERAEKRLRADAPRDASSRFGRTAAPPLETLAQAYAYLGDLDAALRVANQAQTADPTRIQSYLTAGKCYLTLKQPAKALPLLRRACTLAPENADAHYTLALALLASPDSSHEEAALQSLSTAVSLNPQFAPAYFQQGLLYAKRRKWTEAHRAFISAYQLHFEPMETLRRAGEAYRQEGDEAKANYLLGQYAQETGDLKTALERFRALSQLPAYRVSGYAHTAAVLRSMGKQQEAIDTLKTAIKLEPKSAELYRQIAGAYSIAKKAVERIAALNKAIELDPQNAHGDYLMLGMMAYDTGKYDEAERYLEQAAQAQPNSGEYQYALGKTYLARAGQGDRLPRAMQRLEEASRLSPGNVYTHTYLTTAYMKAQRWEEAADACRRAIDLEPQNGRHYYRLGQIYQRLGAKEEARQILGYYQKLRSYEQKRDLLQRRVFANPRDIAARLAFGEHLLQGRDYTGAVREFRKVADAQPQNIIAHGRLALLYGELAHPDEQRVHLLKARALSEPEGTKNAAGN